MAHSANEPHTLITVDPTSDANWQDLVEKQRSDVFQTPAWFRTIEATYGFDIRARLLMRDATPVAGLAYATVEGLLGTRLVSFPFSDYCDPLVGSFHQWQLLTGGLGDDRIPVVARCLHSPIPLEDDRFAVTGRAHWHGIDLDPGADDIWDRLAPSARRAVRKSRDAGIEVRPAESAEELRAFYELHLKTRKFKYRMLAQPFAFLESMWREFVEPRQGSLLLARQEGQIVAGVFFLEWKDRLYYKLNASNPRFAETRPNDALMWAGIEHGCRRGYQLMDLGLSDWGQDGLVRYKEKYSSVEGTIWFLRSETLIPVQEGRLSEVLPRLTELLTDERVPDRITEEAGRVLYRHFA